MKEKDNIKDSLLSKIFGCLGSIITFLIGLFIIVSVIKLIDFGFLSSEITEYPVQCKEKPSGNYCKNPEYQLNKTVYKVIKDRQEVIAKSEGFPQLQKYTDCAVIDRKNWTCKADDGSWEFGFSDGEFYRILYTGKEYNVYYVSRLEYIKIICKDDKGIMKLLYIALINLLE